MTPEIKAGLERLRRAKTSRSPNPDRRPIDEARVDLAELVLARLHVIAPTLDLPGVWRQYAAEMWQLTDVMRELKEGA